MSRTGLADELPELEASLLKDPSPRNVMRVADACRLAGRPERSVELLEALLAERPTAIAPVVLKAWCLADLDRMDESAAAVEELRAIDPANPWASGRAIPAPVLTGWDEPGIEVPVAAGSEAAGESVAEPEPEPAEEAVAGPEPEPAGEAVAEPAMEPVGEAEGPASDEPTDEAAEGVVFEIPEGTSDLAAAIAAMSGVELEPESSPRDEPESAPDVELELEPASTGVAEVPEEPAPVEAPDEELEAEPERALTEAELADVPPSPLYSATLAEIFERQGFEEKAMEIYAEVVRTHPERVDLRERIAELERRLPAEPGR